jgi:hypothetical protein
MTLSKGDRQPPSHQCWNGEKQGAFATVKVHKGNGEETAGGSCKGVDGSWEISSDYSTSLVDDVLIKGNRTDNRLPTQLAMSRSIVKGSTVLLAWTT